jgi:Uma2 family endonuclease
VEVISPANTAETVERKLAKYFENGAGEVWVAFPKTRRIWRHQELKAAPSSNSWRSQLPWSRWMYTKPNLGSKVLQNGNLWLMERFREVSSVALLGGRLSVRFKRWRHL